MVALGTVSLLFSGAYLLVYSASVLPLIGVLSTVNINSLKTSHLVSRSSPALLLLFAFFFLNLRGLPPFVGFFAKAARLKTLLLNGHPVLALVLILSRAITIGFYLIILFVAALARAHGPRPSARPRITLFWVLALGYALGGLPLACLLL